MGLETAEAIVLDAIDLHERDRIVVFLTREHGCKRGVARGARTKYSRFAGQLLPLAKARMTWFEKPGRDLVRLSSVESVRAAGRLHDELEGILLAGYLAEHLTEFAQENEESDRLFRLLDSTIEALQGGADRWVVARYFEIWILRLSGIFPSVDACSSCGADLAGTAWLPPSADDLLCAGCGGAPGSLRLGADVMDWLARSRRRSVDEMAAERPPQELLDRLEELAARVRRTFLQKELRSYAVLKRTLSEV